jgi:hypothetical protein
MIDWQSNHYDPIYNTLGVSATIASAGGQSATVTAMDKTSGVSIPDPRTQIETVRPVARVRARELEQAGVLVSDLPEGSILINGQTWRIKTYQPLPSPGGEADGEIMLILLFEI